MKKLIIVCALLALLMPVNRQAQTYSIIVDGEEYVNTSESLEGLSDVILSDQELVSSIEDDTLYPIESNGINVGYIEAHDGDLWITVKK